MHLYVFTEQKGGARGRHIFWGRALQLVYITEELFSYLAT